MSLINRTGTFRGDVVDAGVSVTTNKYPQYVAKLQAAEYWDEEEQKWVSWKGVEENEITAYLILFGGTGETLTCQQVKKVTGWDGVAFTGLNNIDFTNFSIQFRVEDNEYKGKTTKQVTWVDAYNATPGGAGIRKLDAAELAQLDAKYKTTLAATAKKAAPVKAAKKTTKKASPPKIPKPTVVPPEVKSNPTGKCTMQEAWDEVSETLSPGIDESIKEDTWMKAVDRIANGVLLEDITEEQWFQIKVAVKDDICIPF